MEQFKAKINIIGVNPFVLLPPLVLTNIFKQAEKNKGPIPVCGTIDGNKFVQTLIKYSGKWRLYINTPMLKSAKKKVGDTIVIQLEFDPVERIIPFHPKLEMELKNNQEAKAIFDKLSPSLQKE